VAKLPEGDDWLYELKLDGSPYSGAVTQQASAGASPSGPEALCEVFPDDLSPWLSSQRADADIEASNLIGAMALAACVYSGVTT
jgi:hypothetical protein